MLRVRTFLQRTKLGVLAPCRLPKKAKLPQKICIIPPGTSTAVENKSCLSATNSRNIPLSVPGLFLQYICIPLSHVSRGREGGGGHSLIVRNPLCHSRTESGIQEKNISLILASLRMGASNSFSTLGCYNFFPKK